MREHKDGKDSKDSKEDKQAETATHGSPSVLRTVSALASVASSARDGDGDSNMNVSDDSGDGTAQPRPRAVTLWLPSSTCLCAGVWFVPLVVTLVDCLICLVAVVHGGHAC